MPNDKINGVPNIKDMWGAPLDMQIYYDGVDTYYCEAVPWTRTTLADTKFRVKKQTVDGGGNIISIRFASDLDTSWPVDVMCGNLLFNLAATSLWVVQGYTYL